MATHATIRVEVDADTPAQRMLADWLRSWRRRGVRAGGKTTYSNQGASIVSQFHAPPAAVTDLQSRFAGVGSATVTYVMA